MDKTCFLMTWKNYFNIFVQKQLTIFSSIHGLFVDGIFKSAPKVFHQIFAIDGLTVCNLHLSYRPLNIQSPDMLFFSLCNKKRLAVPHINRPYFERHYRICPTTLGSRSD